MTTFPGSKLIKYLGSLLGTGGVDRMLHDKLSENISVKDFGAKGDGVTDDTAAINASKVAGYVYVPPGVYKITDYTIIQSTSTFWGPGIFNINSWNFPAGQINSFVNVPVPSVFPTIQAAVTYVEGKVITENGFCSINIANGTYNIGQIECHFPTGKDRVQIIGNQTTPANVVINADMSNNQCAFLFQRGSGIQLIDGVTINGINGWVSHGVWNNQVYGAGIMATYGSYVVVGSHTRINKCYYGISSRYSSTIYVGTGVQITEAGDVGYHAFASSSINCQNTQASLCAHTSQGLGAGYCAEGGSFIDCSFSSSFSNGTMGFLSMNGSGFWAHSCVSHNNSAHGFAAVNGAAMECNHAGTDPVCNSYQNAGAGYHVQNNAYMNCNSANADTNTLNGFFCDGSSMMDITVASSSNSGSNGFSCTNESVMNGNASNTYNNTLNGYYAAFGGTITSSSGAVANSNHNYGYFASTMGTLNMIGGTGSGNTTGLRFPVANGFSTTNGCYIAM